MITTDMITHVCRSHFSSNMVPTPPKAGRFAAGAAQPPADEGGSMGGSAAAAPSQPASASKGQVWKSLNKNKPKSWTQEAATALATSWKDALPRGVLLNIQNGKMTGKPLVSLTFSHKDSIPTPQDVKKNIFWLRPLCSSFPKRTPSLFHIADSLLILDHQCQGLLFKSDGREDAAQREADKIGALVGKLRDMKRGGGASHATLKSRSSRPCS